VELNTERVPGAIEGKVQIQWNDPTRFGGFADTQRFTSSTDRN